MKYVMVLFLTAASCFARSSETVKVHIEGTELDKQILLEKLNSHGPDHGLRFEAADEHFDYRIMFGTGQEQSQFIVGGSGGSYNTSTAQVSVFDAGGKELFRFNRAGRGTDSAAANAVAKEIIKRLTKLKELQKKNAA